MSNQIIELADAYAYATINTNDPEVRRGHAREELVREVAYTNRIIDNLRGQLKEAAEVIEQRNAMLSRGRDDFMQALTDPENQPSQWGTVTLDMYEKVEADRDALREKLAAVEKDAARYRALKRRHSYTIVRGLLGQTGYASHKASDQIDTFADEALSEVAAWEALTEEQKDKHFKDEIAALKEATK